MAAAKGTQPPGGSRKGKPNKVTADLKAMILGALNAQEGGGQAYLQRQADENPVAFMGLIGKLLPKDVTVESNSTVAISNDRVEFARRILEETFGVLEDDEGGAGVVH